MPSLKYVHHAVVAGVFAACLGAGPVLAAGETLRFAIQSPISSFDPDNSFETGGLGAVTAVYQGLVQYQPGTTKVVGLLAKSWEVSADGLTYTFHLQDGVTFHDGRPMTAADVIASFARRKDNKLTLSYFVLGIDTMSAPDPLTVSLKLKGPDTSFLDTLASPWEPKVVSAAALAAHSGSDGQAWFKTNTDGTGPYKLT